MSEPFDNGHAQGHADATTEAEVLIKKETGLDSLADLVKAFKATGESGAKRAYALRENKRLRRALVEVETVVRGVNGPLAVGHGHRPRRRRS